MAWSLKPRSSKRARMWQACKPFGHHEKLKDILAVDESTHAVAHFTHLEIEVNYYFKGS